MPALLAVLILVPFVLEWWLWEMRGFSPEELAYIKLMILAANKKPEPLRSRESSGTEEETVQNSSEQFIFQRENFGERGSASIEDSRRL
jgi:hypothetical protein